jgi:hypothetical protein
VGGAEKGDGPSIRVGRPEEQGADLEPAVIELAQGGDQIGGFEAFLVRVEPAKGGESSGASLDMEGGDRGDIEEAAKNHRADEGGIARGERGQQLREAVTAGGILKDDAAAAAMDVVDLEPVEGDERGALEGLADHVANLLGEMGQITNRPPPGAIGRAKGFADEIRDVGLAGAFGFCFLEEHAAKASLILEKATQRGGLGKGLSEGRAGGGWTTGGPDRAQGKGGGFGHCGMGYGKPGVLALAGRVN